MAELPDDVVASAQPFKVLQSHVQYLMAELEAKKTEMDKLAKEADNMRESLETFRSKVSVR